MANATCPNAVAYVIGDIHGRDDLLKILHGQVGADAERHGKKSIVVYLGDYVSRGKNSRAVIDLIRTWLPDGFERIALKGNHEDLLLRFLDGDLDAGRHWFDYGGLDTLRHYDVSIPDPLARDDASIAMLRDGFAAALPQAHLDFFEALQVSHRLGDYYFVHAGVRPGVTLADQNDHDRMWIRQSFLDSDVIHGAIIVHGHCISSRPVVRHNRIGIDTGAYHSGVLTCLVLDRATRDFLQT